MTAMERLCPNEYKKRAKQTNVYNMGVYSRQGVDNSLETVQYTTFAPEFAIPPPVPDMPFNLEFRMYRNSIWIGGRYCKYTRHLPQTPWLIKGVRKCGSSVEELIGDRLKEYLQCEQIKFLASGREDVDVRMLGTGRPFAFECVNSKKTKLSQSNLDELTQFINEHHEAVQVNSLSLVTKKCIKRLKQGEEEKRKKYTALCRTKHPYCLETLKKLESTSDLVIKQETPVRVLHRRSNAFRDKIVHSMAVSQVSPTLFKLSVISAAGTYIKELVHGDFERTQPNLCNMLGLETDILALDVEEVCLEWPAVHQKNGGGQH
jgi:tRNA pseudouridine synthase 10